MQILSFWLALGVDGFRVDAALFLIRPCWWAHYRGRRRAWQLLALAMS